MIEELEDISLMEDDDEGRSDLYEHLRMEVDHGQQPVRIDKYMSEHVQHSSRNRIQKAADAGFIQVNGKPVKSNYKVRPGDIITLMLDRPHYDTTIEPEDIPLDIVYEDDQLMVINKPAGLVVHPGCGNFHGTLVNAIAWHLRDLPSYDPNDPSVGLVHRIDKDTSGLLVIAKTLRQRQSWEHSSSTMTLIVAIRHWYGVTSRRIQVVLREISDVTRKTASAWQCFLPALRWARVPSHITKYWNATAM